MEEVLVPEAQGKAEGWVMGAVVQAHLRGTPSGLRWHPGLSVWTGGCRSPHLHTHV